MAGLAADWLKAAGYVNPARAISLLQELIRIPSPTGQEGSVSRFLAGYLEGLGIDLVHTGALWDVSACLRGNHPGPSVVLVAFLDCPPAGEMENPHAGTLLPGSAFGKPGQVVYGRGAAADKGGVAAALEAMASLTAFGRQHLKGEVRLALATRALGASHDGLRSIHVQEPIRADMGIVVDPTDNRIGLGARGVHYLEVTLHGRSTHASQPVRRGSAVFALPDLLRRVENLDLPADPDVGPASLSCTELATVGLPPLTPHAVRAVFDRRTLPEERIEDSLARFRQLLGEVTAERPEVQAEVRVVRAMLPFRVDARQPAVQHLDTVLRAVSGREPEHSFLSYSTNAGFLNAALGIPSVCFGPGRVEDVGDREHVRADHVAEAAQVIAATVARVLG